MAAHYTASLFVQERQTALITIPSSSICELNVHRGFYLDHVVIIITKKVIDLYSCIPYYRLWKGKY